jgi:hypothetical protein
MTSGRDEEKRSPPTPSAPPPPPPVRRPNIEERISMIQMAMLHHKGRYQPSLSSPGAIALVLPHLPTHAVAISLPTMASSLPNPKVVLLQQNPPHHNHPKKEGMLQRFASSLGCRDKTKKHTKKGKKHGYHVPPVEDVYVRRLDESEW